MTKEEYKKRDAELIFSINEYNLDSAEHKLQIAINAKQVALLEIERADLHNQYRNEQ